MNRKEEERMQLQNHQLKIEISDLKQCLKDKGEIIHNREWDEDIVDCKDSVYIRIGNSILKKKDILSIIVDNDYRGLNYNVGYKIIVHLENSTSIRVIGKLTWGEATRLIKICYNKIDCLK